MKKSSILKLVSTIAFAAAGAFAVGAAKSGKKAEAVKAATDGWNIVGVGGWDAGHAIAMDAGSGSDIAKKVGFVVEEANTEFKLAYLTNDNIDWGGAKGTGALDSKSYVFQDGSDNIRLKFAGTYNIYLSSSYNIYLSRDLTITFNANGGSVAKTSKTVAQTYEGDANSVYGDLPTPTLAGHTFDGWYTEETGGNKVTSASSTTALLGDQTLYAHWRVTYASGRYIVGDYGDSNWGPENAVLMDYVENQDVGTVSLEYGDKIKVAWYSDESGIVNNHYGYSAVRPGSGAYHYFSNDGDDNIVCYARGSYTIYFKENGYDEGTRSISIELNGSLTAEHLAAQLMSFGAPTEGEGDRTCGEASKFPAMKLIFLGLSPEEQATFQGYSSSEVDQFKNAYERYVAWAAALQEKPWEAGKTSGAPNNIFSSNESNNLIVIVSIVSLISASTLVGLIVIKRRKGVAK